VLHGDELKTSAKMIKVAKQHVTDGKSVVFDATNPSKKKRQEYIEFAKSHGLQVRCVHVATSLEESIYRNNQRPKEKIVPRIVYHLYNKNFEEPNESEGCHVVKVS
jgi:bifunctional polynucleotide phosphatase/kinase